MVEGETTSSVASSIGAESTVVVEVTGVDDSEGAEDGEDDLDDFNFLAFVDGWEGVSADGDVVEDVNSMGSTGGRLADGGTIDGDGTVGAIVGETIGDFPLVFEDAFLLDGGEMTGESVSAIVMSDRLEVDFFRLDEVGTESGDEIGSVGG